MAGYYRATRKTARHADGRNAVIAWCVCLARKGKCKMKHYIFLTTDGQTKDDTGTPVDNCQQIANIVKAGSALDAYNILLETDGFYGEFDSCFCYELANDGKIQGRFDLITDRN